MNLFGKKSEKKEQRELVRTVRNSDKGKKQAKEQLKAMVESGDEETLGRIAKARVRLYSQAAYEGDGKAQYRMGISQAKLGNKEVSLEWLTGLAKQGDVKAMKAIARGYAPNGIYGYRREEYRYWTQKAAEAGDARAQAQLGDFYAGKYENQSRYWYKQSALQNCPPGYIGLGRACYNEALRSFGGEETRRRGKMLKRAETCFLRALEFSAKDEELAAASRELGILYEAMENERTVLEDDERDFAKLSAQFYDQAWQKGKQEEDLASYNRIRQRL